jgi:hypothetical protein
VNKLWEQSSSSEAKAVQLMSTYHAYGACSFITALPNSADGEPNFEPTVGTEIYIGSFNILLLLL